MFLSPMLFISCMAPVRVSFLRPARINHPAHIQTLALAAAISDSITPACLPRGACIKALQNSLHASLRYTVKDAQKQFFRIYDDKPLTWTQIHEICRITQSDALLLMEDFETHVTTHATKNYYDEWTLSQTLALHIHWVLYDTLHNRITDRYAFQTVNRIAARGITKENAFERLPSASLALLDMADVAGRQYAQRIAPYWQVFDRRIDLTLNKAMMKAWQYAREKNWRQAAAIWQKIVVEQSGPNPRLAGKAAYNMAVACEMLGEIQLAISWAQEACFKFDDSQAGNYILSLRKRNMDAYLIASQLEEYDNMYSSEMYPYETDKKKADP